MALTGTWVNESKTRSGDLTLRELVPTYIEKDDGAAAIRRENRIAATDDNFIVWKA